MADTTTSPAPAAPIDQQQLPAPVLDPVKFGNLIHVPKTVQENQLSASKARAATTAALKDFQGVVDYTKLDLAKMEDPKTGAVVALNSLRAKLVNTLEKAEGKRKPFTSFFDDIRSLFTKSEKSIKEDVESLKTVLDAWEKEKARRAKELAIEQQKQIDTANEAIDVKARIEEGIKRKYLTELASMVERLNAKYNEQPIDKLEAYGETLKTWVIVFKTAVLDGWTFAKPVALKFHKIESVPEWATEIRAKLHAGLSKDWDEKLDAERNRLILYIPSRIAALKTNAEAEAKRIADEAAQRQAAAAQQQQWSAQRVETQAAADKVNTTFAVASTAAVAPTKGAGTVEKKIYKPTTMAAWTAIIQSYILHVLPTLTPADTAKKFDFMLTAANKRLAAGEKIEAEGLLIEDEFSTRTTR